VVKWGWFFAVKFAKQSDDRRDDLAGFVDNLTISSSAVQFLIDNVDRRKRGPPSLNAPSRSLSGTLASSSASRLPRSINRALL